jgi:hypothetical protein
MTTLSNNTPQFPLAPSDGRSFFEVTLSEAQKRGLLSKEAVQKILDDGPKGMIQIAQTFGNVHHA